MFSHWLSPTPFMLIGMMMNFIIIWDVYLVFFLSMKDQIACGQINWALTIVLQEENCNERLSVAIIWAPISYTNCMRFLSIQVAHLLTFRISRHKVRLCSFGWFCLLACQSLFLWGRNGTLFAAVPMVKSLLQDHWHYNWLKDNSKGTWVAKVFV